MPEPDPKKTRAFESSEDLGGWLEANHAVESELWVKVFKKQSGVPSVTWDDIVTQVLCWGWIDAIKKSWDDVSFVQRYCPRKPRSAWSQINRDNVARLIANGQMTDHGLAHVDAAKADGRWDAAYSTTMDPPEDLLAAIATNPAAAATYGVLTAQSTMNMMLDNKKHFLKNRSVF